VCIYQDTYRVSGIPLPLMVLQGSKMSSSIGYFV
jgi:hypothetical protein